MSHYFTTDNTPHEFSEIKFSFNGHVYRFKTDRGVFSKNQIDYGTEVLIKTVFEDFKGAGQLIDMGAGYGPIGTVLGRELGMEPVMVEVNEDAIQLSIENTSRENIEAGVLDRESYSEMDFSVPLYVTNPPFRAGKDTVTGILNDGFERLQKKGVLYMVVQKKQGMPSYKKHLKSLFGNVEIASKDKGYYILKSIK
ncbi:Ribosomal RNA small subunit methyltransferase C [Jeotgalicoccus saudimassiliensis]|uniref:Ribosomal RNA small subunit methyltransferase C n=1 Tax=Jeotgalicoccus saudimassiliensis TaxID=1461582 RepID=A0A078MBK0_9STAP|nr:methyltransferase [Jeotgalicoccus saudimassiliensis]CEA02812.1 Ribosomal RNA small subunit methyltransferase C [Jeotgalicoccus saudimassiliensis]